jgi:hypothetical protein
MQKVVGSSPISRFANARSTSGFLRVVRSLVRLIMGRTLDSEWTVIPMSGT